MTALATKCDTVHMYCSSENLLNHEMVLSYCPTLECGSYYCGISLDLLDIPYMTGVVPETGATCHDSA